MNRCLETFYEGRQRISELYERKDRKLRDKLKDDLESLATEGCHPWRIADFQDALEHLYDNWRKYNRLTWTDEKTRDIEGVAVPDSFREFHLGLVERGRKISWSAQVIGGLIEPGIQFVERADWASLTATIQKSNDAISKVKPFAWMLPESAVTRIGDQAASGISTIADVFSAFDEAVRAGTAVAYGKPGDGAVSALQTAVGLFPVFGGLWAEAVANIPNFVGVVKNYDDKRVEYLRKAIGESF